MTTYSGGYGVAGSGTIQQSKEYEILWGGDMAKGLVLRKGCVYSSSIADAGNTPTTDIRAGLLVGKVTSSGEMEEWDADASDGTQELAGVVPTGFRSIDQFANSADREIHMIVSAPLKASQLFIQGTAFTSHTDQYLARRLLHAMGCRLDDDPAGLLTGLVPRYVTDATTSVTLTAAQTGQVLTISNAASTTVNLPTIQAGLRYRIIRIGDEEFVLDGASNIITDNNASADTITFTTASEHVGAYVDVEAIYYGTTLKWFVQKSDALTAAVA